ncbi:MAG: adenosylmethionine decarboxylase [Deltaproteobacteria bacterium]|nr:MAG: adenosylmethionine decarboxylase [Deltaproteobacteria bacterium]
MKSLGKHLIIEFFQCDSTILNDLRTLENHLLAAVQLSGATIIQPLLHQFSPHGITGVVVVAESHFAVHTWPEYGYCALDIFTCGDSVDGHIALNYLKENLKAANTSVMEVKRGVLDLPQSQIKHKPDQDAA